ncbi:NADase-type glycan-binding domain-containing protein [Kribbella sp. NPDC051620]|uniref:NADase-type glycan-binding domain-containing protein n=1 Tax=Kribbella sp. NPDC051620 TaxID=3364120 RepID=UPI0037BD879B
MLALIAGGGVLAGPQRGLVMSGVHKVQDQFAEPLQVRPTASKASGVAGKQGAQLAFDGAKNTYWGAPRTGKTAKPVPWVTAGFRSPIKLTAFTIYAGVAPETPKFVAGPRPAEIEVTVITGGEPVIQRFTLKDVPTKQEFKLKVDDARAVQVAIVRTIAPTRSTLTAIAELEFFARR